MLSPLEKIPLEELQIRWARLRHIVQENLPQVQGLLVFSRTNIYRLSGHWADGAFWLPLESEPLLLIRKGMHRAKLESPIKQIHSFRFYKDIPKVFSEYGISLPDIVAVEMSGLTWLQGQKLVKHIPDKEFVSCDQALNKARSVKTDWELEKIRLAGQRHHTCIYERLPHKIEPNMNEREIAIEIWKEFYAEGHQGLIRTKAQSQEMYLGAIAAGDSGIYPTAINGPLGIRGMHPAVPHMGYAGKVWLEKEILTVDTIFALEGYYTDKTQLFWADKKKNLPGTIDAAQRFCLDLHKWLAVNLYPGKMVSELYNYSVELASKQGWSEGFMGLNGNKVAFIGHGIGLFVDDWPPLAKKMNIPLEKNMVIAIEPKIGIPEVGMVGIENTFLVTENGGESLTGDVFDIICIE